MLMYNNGIIIDNTNPSLENRKLYINAANFYGYEVFCLWFTCNKEISKHNNYYRNYKSSFNKNICNFKKNSS
jgi:predicted kinase